MGLPENWFENFGYWAASSSDSDEKSDEESNKQGEFVFNCRDGLC
jgi:hypothetical protein